MLVVMSAMKAMVFGLWSRTYLDESSGVQPLNASYSWVHSVAFLRIPVLRTGTSKTQQTQQIKSNYFKGLVTAFLIIGLTASFMPQQARADGISFRKIPGKNYEVVTSIAQLGEPLAHITGSCVYVKSLLGSGTDPHLYRLSRADVRKMHRSGMVQYVGHLLEAQMKPFLHLLSITKPVYPVGELINPKLMMEVEPGIHDPHLWMDPILWSEVLGIALNIIIDQYPECEKVIMARANMYFYELGVLHEKTEKLFYSIPKEKRILVTSHDAFGYFGARFGIKVLAIQGISTDRQISINKINSLVDSLIEYDIKSVFVESSVSSRDIYAVIEGAASRGHEIKIGGTLYSDAMGESGTWEGTYIGMLEHNIRTIATAWGVDTSILDSVTLDSL